MMHKLQSVFYKSSFLQLSFVQVNELAYYGKQDAEEWSVQKSENNKITGEISFS